MQTRIIPNLAQKLKTIEFPDGILVVKKEKYYTSNGLLNVIKKLSKNKIKVGHAGTLDNEATGLMILGIGEGTKLLSKLIGSPKRYRTTILFGNKTTMSNETGDIIQPFRPFDHIKKEMIDNLIKTEYIGEIPQKAPVFSALKKNGVRLSDLAKKGHHVEPPIRLVKIYESNCTLLKLPIAEFDLRVSSGFYVRSFAEEISEKLNTAGYTVEINRSSVGPYSEENSLLLTEISNENVKNNIEKNTKILLDLINNKQLEIEKSKTISPAFIRYKDNKENIE